MGSFACRHIRKRLNLSQKMAGRKEGSRDRGWRGYESGEEIFIICIKKIGGGRASSRSQGVAIQKKKGILTRKAIARWE